MNEHNRIRELVVLAAAGILTATQEKHVVKHMRSCIVCSNELNIWQSITTDLRGLPTPQPSSRLMQVTLARAQMRLTGQAEHDWNRCVMIFVVAFAWLLIVAAWPVSHFASRHFGNMLGPQFGSTWIGFAAFVALAWLEGGVAAAMLAIRHRGKRRLA
jgi:hypothetical protein